MKYFATMLATAVLMLPFGATPADAAEQSVKMTFSGNSTTSATNLQEPNTSNDQDTFAGNGTLGAFTVTNLRAIANNPSYFSSCSGSNQIFFAELAGAGVFRFQDGSLLEVQLTQGGDCIEGNGAQCILTLKITGGTGRFKNASGVLTMTETVAVVVTNSPADPVFFAATGEYTGTISGVETENNQDRKE